MYYPATRAGVDKPVHTGFRKYPVVLIAHGRHGGAGNSYLGYDYLGRHLASRGFICASVALNELSVGWRIHHRGVTILRHLKGLLVSPTTDSVISNVRPRMNKHWVGLLGHSRGGEGVAAAQQIFESTSPPPGYTIRAVATFSPTDGPVWSESSPQGGPYSPTVPYLMIYGTEDGDLRGYAGNTGFRTHDRVQRPRHLVAIYGGNHNYFNENWSSDGSPTISRSQQEKMAKALVTPFFSDLLLDQQAYVELLSGYAVPPSISGAGTTVLFSDQPKRLISIIVDDSQDVPPGEATNSLSKANVALGLLFDEESLRYETVPARNYYTHDTDGLRVRWISRRGLVRFKIGRRSLIFNDFLSFRVAQRYRNTGSLNPANSAQNFTVHLRDEAGRDSPPIRVGLFVPIHYTAVRNDVYTKSILQTVRIPLRLFAANNSTLDLGRVTEIRFVFNRALRGELILDDVEFLGLDLTEPETP
jgi:hypothetical protein